MKTIIGALLALGLLSTSASAWYCAPGYGYGHHRPTYGHLPKKVEKPVVPVEKAEPAPAPAPEPVPQK